MKPITAEWVAKAEGDFAVLEREINVRDNPSYDAICFHAQQCAEKLGGFLLSSGRLARYNIGFWWLRRMK